MILSTVIEPSCVYLTVWTIHCGESSEDLESLQFTPVEFEEIIQGFHLELQKNLSLD